MARQLFAGHVPEGGPVRERLLGGTAKLAGPFLAGGAPGGSGGSRPDRRDHALCTVAARIAAGADGPGVLILVHDLHWADMASLRLLVSLRERLADLPALVVGAGRPVLAGPGAQLISRLAGLRGGRALTLAPLRPAAISVLVQRAWGESPDLSLEVGARPQICRRRRSAYATETCHPRVEPGSLARREAVIRARRLRSPRRA